LAWVEEDHNDHLVSAPPCCLQGCKPGCSRATSSLALNASRHGASTASLGNLFQRVTPLCVEKLLPNIQPKPPLSQFNEEWFYPITIHPHICHGLSSTFQYSTSGPFQKSVGAFFLSCWAHKVKYPMVASFTNPYAPFSLM